MDDIQPFKESGVGGPTHLDSKAKCEPEFSVKNEAELDNYEIKEEYCEDTDEVSIPI